MARRTTKISSALLLGLGTAIAVYLISRIHEKPSTLGSGAQAATSAVANDHAEPEDRLSELQSENSSFDSEIDKLRTFSRQTQSSDIKLFASGLIQDAQKIHRLTSSRFASCLSDNHANVHTCYPDYAANLATVSDIAGEGDIGSANIEQVRSENEGWKPLLDQRQSRATNAVAKIIGDAKTVDRCTTSFAQIQTLLMQAEQYKDQSDVTEQDNPVASSLLIHHSLLLFDELVWRTSSCGTGLSTSK